MSKAIVVGVDGAWRRSGALDWAVHEATERRMPLRAVHVMDERMGRVAGAPVRLDGQVIIPAQVAEADSRLVDDVEKHLVDAALPVDAGTDVLVGSPDRRLAELSAEAALTVVGRHGSGGFARALIGSTSEYVAMHGTGPVVVVPQTWRWAEHRTAPIVVGVGDHDDSEAGIAFGYELAALRGVPIWLVHAWEVTMPYSYDITTAPEMSDALKQLARRRLDAVADRWQTRFPNVHSERSLQQNHAVQALLDVAETTAAQLTVVGGRRHRMPGLIPGSVARGILRHATTPVAVVHESSSVG
ncbi:universal stress protein [Kribbella sp. NPDC020789]